LLPPSIGRDIAIATFPLSATQNDYKHSIVYAKPFFELLRENIISQQQQRRNALINNNNQIPYSVKFFMDVVNEGEADNIGFSRIENCIKGTATDVLSILYYYCITNAYSLQQKFTSHLIIRNSRNVLTT
jgi:hypothetical protein